MNKFKQMNGFGELGATSIGGPNPNATPEQLKNFDKMAALLYEAAALVQPDQVAAYLIYIGQLYDSNFQQQRLASIAKMGNSAAATGDEEHSKLKRLLNQATAPIAEKLDKLLDSGQHELEVSKTAQSAASAHSTLAGIGLPIEDEKQLNEGTSSEERAHAILAGVGR